MQFTQLVYVSSYVDEYGFDLPNFIDTIALANNQFDIRGMTLFANGNIMQLLEGQSKGLMNIFEKLRYDAKQLGVLELLRTPIASHCLSETAIGYSAHELQLITKSPANISLFHLASDEVEKRILDSPGKPLMLQFAADHC